MSRAPIPAILVVGVLAAACSASQAPGSNAPSPSVQASAAARQLIGPGTGLSDGAVYGDLVWTAGHLPYDLSVDAPIEDQVNEVLDNLEVTLDQADAGFDTLLMTPVYLLDWDDWEAFNEIYEERIGREFLAPPRTTVQVAHIGLDYRIEIEMVAHVRTSSP